MMTNHAQTGPVVLLTGHPYDAPPPPASSQNNSADADVNMDDASNALYPQRRNIPGMESILEESQYDPIGARVISSFSSSVAATPAAASSSSRLPFSSSSNPSSIGPTPFTITPIDTPTRQCSASTTFGADEVDNGDGGSALFSNLQPQVQNPRSLDPPLPRASKKSCQKLCGPASKTCFRQESRLRRNTQRGRKCAFNLPGKKARDKSVCELKSVVGSWRWCR
ncbi:uncharacterized protein UBRO_20806 [Ustilago bromivora]|uniref:Uncharacterized protein n=1 Tax=Ustilago bromivora TaxID=307758 RepID=A0A1K0G8H0_9BASI|nr:uncharacterized protein UBRO_20806 [Ustilago bromivora]